MTERPPCFGRRIRLRARGGSTSGAGEGHREYVQIVADAGPGSQWQPKDNDEESFEGRARFAAAVRRTTFLSDAKPLTGRIWDAAYVSWRAALAVGRYVAGWQPEECEGAGVWPVSTRIHTDAVVTEVIKFIPTAVSSRPNRQGRVPVTVLRTRDLVPDSFIINFRIPAHVVGFTALFSQRFYSFC